MRRRKMYLFCSRIDDGLSRIWKSASEWLDFERITGFTTDETEYITTSPDEIKSRQEVFRDVIANGGIADAFSDVVRMIRDLEEVRRQSAVYSSKTTEQALYTIRSYSLIFEIVERIVKVGREYSDKISSERLKSFFEEVVKFGKDPAFEEDREYINATADGVDYAKSMTLCVNLDAKLEPYEVGVLGVHDKPFMSSSVITGLLGDRGASQIKHISPLVPSPASAGVKAAVYQYLNSGISKSLRKKTETMSARMNKYMYFLSNIKEELVFLIRGVRFIDSVREGARGLSYPEAANKYEVDSLYSQRLSVGGKVKVVPNDIKSVGEHRLYLLTGANNGGKSIFINMAGVTQISFQLGLPIPAGKSKMIIFDKLFCHFPNTETDRDSRFVDECRRMKSILDSVGTTSLILMDESFSSTGDDEGTEVAVGVLERISKSGAYCFFSTHLHSLGERVKDGTLEMEPMSVGMDGDTPTYRIEYGKIDDYSHAMRIAEEFDLV